jgi:hypothetical protein
LLSGENFADVLELELQRRSKHGENFRLLSGENLADVLELEPQRISRRIEPDAERISGWFIVRVRGCLGIEPESRETLQTRRNEQVY